MESRHVIRLGFIGAGQVNFGGGEGPWDHATRLENLCSKFDIQCVGIADVDVPRAKKVLEKRRQSSLAPEMWKETQVFQDFVEMLDKSKPEAVFIGTFPESHGTINAPNDMEVQCAHRNIHMLIEKPISCHPVSDVEKVAQIIANKDLIVSVAYMFRYSKAILKMKELIAAYGPVKVFNARYDCAYSTLSKEMWWDLTKSGGPIVEQATHFCDLARYLVGEIDMSSVRAIAIKQTDPAGKLNSLPPNVEKLEKQLPPEKRINRVTSAFWKFHNGAVGALTHGALLHEIKYESELEVWGDGYRFVLRYPYNDCRLSIRLPHSEKEEVMQFKDDDPYWSEDKAFLQAIVSHQPELIQSPFHDALNTYKFTWNITDQSNK